MFSALLFISSAFSATLPDGYTELEYLTSTNSAQYIEDTSFQTINTGVIEIKTKTLAYNTRFVGFGDSLKSGVSIGLATNYTSMSSYRDIPASYGGWNDVYNNVDYTSSSTFVFRYEFTQGTQKLYINETLNKTFSQTKGTDTYNFRLFNVTPANGSINGTNTIYYCRVYDGSGNLLREYIPARRNSDNVLGMYDTVTNTFYTNSGTGSFVAGPAVSDEPSCEYTRLEYIESTGTQYIDTGVKLSDNDKTYYDVDFEITRNTSYRSLWGAYGGYSSNGDTRTGYLYVGANYLQFAVGASNDAMLTSYPTSGLAGVRHHWLLYVDDNTKERTITNIQNSSIISTSTFSGTLLKNVNICLFGFPGGERSYLKLYSFKITINGTPVRDFIPARRNSDGVLGMYDTVTNTFFTNAGTGTFIAGPELAWGNNCSVTISITWDGVAEPDASGMCTYGETFTAPSTAPTAPSGLKFLGWIPR